MKTTLLYTAADGKTLNLFEDEYFDLVNVDGLTKIDSSLAVATIPSMDGANINNIQAQPRGVVLDLHVKNYIDVELCKRHILNVIKPKQNGTFTLIQGTGKDERKMQLIGTVESLNMPRFNNKVTMQIEFYCAAPFWQDVEDIILIISRAIANHHFVLAIPYSRPLVLGIIDRKMTQTYTNDGDVSAGMVITIIATGEVTNPVLYRKDGVYIGINDTLVENDKVVIDTTVGHKTITKNGVSIFSKIKQGSTFFQMETGDNEFTIDTDDEGSNVYFSIAFKRRFV